MHVPKQKPRQRGDRQLERPEYNSTVERKRRAETVAAFLAEHGKPARDGNTIARCPECHEMRGRFIADHVVPIAEGGREDGELRIHCSRCSGRQGANLAARRKRGLI